MQAIDAAAIRASMINCSKGEATRMALPASLATLDWDFIEFLGWRDPKAQQRAYLVHRQDDRWVGVALRAPDGASRKSAACILCRTTHTAGGVALFVARLAGAAGRNENTIGTYICADLACSAYIRRPKASLAVTPEPGVDVAQRMAGLHERTAGFLRRVLGTG